MYKVYWTDSAGQSHGREHASITAMLEHSRNLREQPGMRFITTVGEDPNCVSLQGVSDPAADYAWKKRRKT